MEYGAYNVLGMTLMAIFGLWAIYRGLRDVRPKDSREERKEP